MGMLNSLGPLLHPGAVAGDVQRRQHRDGGDAGSVCAALGVRPITIVALATLVGGIGAARDPVAAAAQGRFPLPAVLDCSDEGLRRVLLLMGPGTHRHGGDADQRASSTRMLATSQGTGAVSWLDFAFRLMYLPIGLFGVSIATAATPAISRLVGAAGLRRRCARRWRTRSG